jgi:uncharacterized protein YerC
MPSKSASLHAAILTCGNDSEVKDFLIDLLAETEFEHAERRWEIAKTYMRTGCSQREARRRHGGAIELIHRVYKSVEEGTGYRRAFKSLFPTQPIHTNVKSRG